MHVPLKAWFRLTQFPLERDFTVLLCSSAADSNVRNRLIDQGKNTCSVLTSSWHKSHCMSPGHIRYELVHYGMPFYLSLRYFDNGFRLLMLKTLPDLAYSKIFNNFKYQLHFLISAQPPSPPKETAFRSPPTNSILMTLPTLFSFSSYYFYHQTRCCVVTNVIMFCTYKVAL
jgi:hypothetical protein